MNRTNEKFIKVKEETKVMWKKGKHTKRGYIIKMEARDEKRKGRMG